MKAHSDTWTLLVLRYAMNRYANPITITKRLDAEGDYSEQRIAELLVRDLSFMSPNDKEFSDTKKVLQELGYSTGGF